MSERTTDLLRAAHEAYSSISTPDAIRAPSRVLLDRAIGCLRRAPTNLAIGLPDPC
jgi:hypothetical protein